MRQLPVTSNSGATGTTENSRSRSHHSANDSGGVKTLSNGSLKEPIVTRSKSRLRVGRRRDRSKSPKKHPNLHKANDTEAHSSKKVGSNGNPSNSGNQVTSLSPAKNNATSHTEKMYARHYKSYRGLNGVKSRRGERGEDRSSNSKDDKDSSDDSISESPAPKGKQPRRAASKLKLKVCKTASPKNNHVQQNGISHSSPSKGTRNPSSRIRQLLIKRNKQLSNRSRRSFREVSFEPSTAPTTKEDDKEDQKEKDKAGKRRSALWVLNCEAESFLFGETAAEKHEVELPPLAPPSPPPKKRRWRVNELGRLLEKSPILESKLRKSSSSESGSDIPREASPPRKRLKASKPSEAQVGTGTKSVKSTKQQKEKEETPEMCSSPNKSVKANNPVLSPRPKSELSSPIPFLYSPEAIDYEAKSLEFRQMLSNVKYSYSFEFPPINESWYSAFARTEDSIVPYTSFLNPLQEQVVLPYEMDKPIRRSRMKPVRNSRKSPRCHASTLAMLSSEKPTRSTRSSVTLDSSPSSSVNNLQTADSPTLSTLMLSPAPHTAPALSTPATPTSTGTRLLKQSPTSTRRRHSSASPRPNQANPSKHELGAAQYLWDSIQFLSDPYVVNILSGLDPHAVPEQQRQENSKSKLSIKNNRCSNNNYVDCPVKNLIRNLERSARKASLRSGDQSAPAPNVSANSNNLTNPRLASVPKSSPRNQSHGTNSSSGRNSVSSPPTSPRATVNNSDRVLPVNGVSRRFTSRSPPSSPPPPAKQTVCPVPRLSPKNSKGTNAKQSKSVNSTGSSGDNGLITNHERASKKSSYVIVTDLFSAPVKSKLNNWDEESLFAGDGLPPLPSWPV